MSETHQCSKRVYGSGRLFGGSPCARKGVVERGGKWWCKQHDPEAERARAEARSAKWRAEREAEQSTKDSAQGLAERLGVGTPHYDAFDHTFTGGVTLTAEEAERLIARLEDRRADEEGL